jgi:hypothetical protein
MSARARLVALLLLAPALTRAQEGGGAFSLPLPSADLPDGVLTIKVVGDGMGDLKVGQEVRLERLEGEKVVETKSEKAADDGRAKFEGLRGGAVYRARASAAGKEHRSQPFNGPAKGGLRLLLTLGGGGASPHPGSGGPAPGAMPPGHPAVPGTGGMPPGHPAAEGGGGAAELTPDKALPDGTILVQVRRGRERKPLPGARVRVRTAVKGIAANAVTDADGQLRLALGRGPASLPVRRPASAPTSQPTSAPASQPAQDAPSAIVTVVHDGMSYSSTRLVAPAKGGLRALFTVYDRSPDPTLLRVGEGSHFVAQVAEGALNFMLVLNLVNGGDRVFDPGQAGLLLPLPERARGVELPEDLRSLAAVDAASSTLKVLAPIPPGRLMLRVFFELPYDGPELELRQRFPIASGELVLRLLKDPGVRVSGPGLTPGVEPVAQGDERLFPLAPVKAGNALELTLGSLPHRDRRPVQVALAVGLALALWALVAGLLGPRRRRAREQQREQLFAQLVQLERSKKKNAEEVARRRRELLAELRQVWDEPW